MSADGRRRPDRRPRGAGRHHRAWPRRHATRTPPHRSVGSRTSHRRRRTVTTAAEDSAADAPRGPEGSRRAGALAVAVIVALGLVATFESGSTPSVRSTAPPRRHRRRWRRCPRWRPGRRQRGGPTRRSARRSRIHVDDVTCRGDDDPVDRAADHDPRLAAPVSTTPVTTSTTLASEPTTTTAPPTETTVPAPAP